MNTVVNLRKLLRPAVGNMKDACTNGTMREFCTSIGLPVPADGSDKRGRLHAAFDALPDVDLPDFAQRLIEQRTIGGELRDQVQEILWSHLPFIEISKRSRRDIARMLNSVKLFAHWDHFAQALQDVFVIPEDLRFIFTGQRNGVLEFAHKHFVRNSEDADVERLFEELRAFDLPHRRFGLLLEKLVSADVQVDAEAQDVFVRAINPILQSIGAELRQTSMDGGYPVFTVTSLRSPRGRAKNLIFASSAKPDIRFIDAINNDIEIVSNQDAVLVYDRPISTDGLRWSELQLWWSELTTESDAAKARQALFLRLQACLPESSPPQRLLFRTFFKTFRESVHRLPALLPEVWLHWDPKTVASRGPAALLTHRMDFLMLLPGGARVVIEVDGAQHYADVSGRAEPQKYARMAAGDRALRLAGYEVYRFGGAELQGPEPSKLVYEFFRSLFERHGIPST
ncbi:hypothetical protein N0K08_11935 [Acidovorax sp. Be4]|uniref:AbiJ-NTD3 domain-containing protein n=1 Tax=Acidovorax bellezanensis TaxID=2976702 RepID=A0ABT2PLJ7_9BURK|nr:hypothetical protein [Acidovorax sp. Be4]MCT9811349.1 hypothetical protein [Acidovorax sp. Be4]